MSRLIARTLLTALITVTLLAFADTVKKHGGIRQAITAIAVALTSQDGNAGVP